MNTGKWRSLLICLAVLVMIAATACTKSQPNTSAPGSNQASQNASDIGVVNGKFDPPIEMTVGYNNAGPNALLPNGDTESNNAWTRAYLNELGIKTKVMWNIASDKRVEKVNLAIASKQLPDTMLVTREQFEQLAAAGELTDLTGLIEKYGSPGVKEIYGTKNQAAMKAITVGGKVLGLPYILDKTDRTTLLYVREDWLKKLNLPDPKTIDDLENVAKAFMANGAQYGIAFNKDFSDPSVLGALFNSFHSYPGIFVKDESSGKLINGSYLPGTKIAVQRMQSWYKQGIIPQDFGMKDYQKTMDDLNSGKVGIHFGGIWEAWGGLQQGKDKDPNVEWKEFAIPSIDGTPAKDAVPALDLSLGIFVIKKDFEHPEVLVKMANMYLDRTTSTNMDDFLNYNYNTKGNYQPFLYSFIVTEPIAKNYNLHMKIKEVLQSDETSKLSAEGKNTYDSIKKYRNGDNTQWYVEECYGPTGSLSVIDYYEKNSLWQLNEYLGSPTPSMISKGPTINKLWSEMLTKVVMGADLSEYDKFMEKVGALGNDDIEKEVNDYYTSHQQ